jgi:hypothetical protein
MSFTVFAGSVLCDLGEDLVSWRAILAAEGRQYLRVATIYLLELLV